jgi:hypothetical protein
MTTVGRLLIRKRDLLARLLGNPSLHERDEIETLLKKIDTALDLLGNRAPERRTIRSSTLAYARRQPVDVRAYRLTDNAADFSLASPLPFPAVHLI